MRAITYDHYGSFDQLELREIPLPTLADDAVQVRVRAAGLHVADCFAVRGSPFPMRLAIGLFKPKPGIPGFDFAGVVEAVGANVTAFQAGDEVFGASQATCAEVVCVAQKLVVRKPGNLSFEEAAAVPTSALAALHALRDAAKVQPGQKILINGASGGVGSFAVQLGKHYGAEVTGVCGPSNVARVTALGADRVIDYTREDFTLGGPGYDLILDNVENRSLDDLRRALAPKGTLIVNSGTGATGLRMVVRLIKPLVVSPFVSQNLRRYLSMPNQADLVVLAGLLEAGQIRPLIDRTYPLEETAAALQHIAGGHARGKVVITVSAESG